MDFYTKAVKEIENGPKKGTFELYSDFKVGRSKDLMIRGRSFYAIWDEERNLWSTDEYDVQRLVDADLDEHANKLEQANGIAYTVKHLRSFSSNGWNQFRKYIQNISDNSHQLDETLTFANTEVTKSDYVSRRLSYSLSPGDYSAWNELVGTLYSVEERAKIEWTIGAVVSGDAKKIQKFLVLYGPAGTGKSTILNIVAKLFHGYTTTFDAKALGSNNGQFATEVFKSNPLVAIQQDGDLSKIQDNTKLNSIIAHEDMAMNEKYKSGYTAKVNAFLFMGTNQPVKISDAKSGIIRRLIDVHPSGVTLPSNTYNRLMSQIDFELGAIAQHCLDVYQGLGGATYYNAYRPTEMMLQTDVFFNYIEANYDIFKVQDSTTLKQAYTLYKEFCSDTGIERVLPQYQVREELRNYFENFIDRTVVDGMTMRSYYSGFSANKFKVVSSTENSSSLFLEESTSLLDEMLAEMPAQYATEIETPKKPWNMVKTSLAEIDTSELHFVKVPESHIVIDFDLKDENGEKSLERNLAAASSWPQTYGELSKGGAGVHLHYIYDGDTTTLNNIYSEGIEIKVFNGNSSLRRRVSKCNSVPVSSINSGLPIKEKKMLNEQVIKNEKGLRDLINRCLKKEFNGGGTKSNVDFIKHILDEAYENNVTYDLTEMRPRIVAFANNSSNQPLMALKVVQSIKFQSKDSETLEPIASPVDSINHEPLPVKAKDDRLAFYDLEVYKNLFVAVWKFEGGDIVKMINPTAQEVEGMLNLKLVGFNNRRYDNHILYARYMGYDNEKLYNLSQKIINNDRMGMFGEAYGISYTDIYDFSSKKQGLKKFQIELGIPHKEMDLPWDEPVDEKDWDRVVEYCVNDVESTEKVFNARKQDFVARQILAELSGLTVNDPTTKHTAKIIFGNDRHPQAKFLYTDLSKEFEGYSFDATRKPNKSDYRGEDPGEGGYVYAEPGMYKNVALLDIASMHPTSLIQMNYFGEYTPNFTALRDARVAIKHGDYDAARKMLNGKLAPYLDDEKDAKELSYALKIVINIVYGLTGATFENVFRDVRNVDNIVAKRGSLFMIDLKHACQEKGLKVIHIKTDSIKIPDATPEDIEDIINFGAKYGYDFEHEATYDRFCLVNDAVYIAGKWSEPDEKGGKAFEWDAVGAQFQHPYVYKTLFAQEEYDVEDLAETKQVVKGSMYLDFEHDRPMALYEGMQFVGRTGRFIPVKDSGGVLYTVKPDPKTGENKNYAVTGTSGYLWLEADMVKAKAKDVHIDMSYFENLADKAKTTIEKFGNFEEFIS